MQTDDPAFIPAGTEISAKFKGAFCEAKVKRVQKCVKCKVTFKDAPFGSGLFSIESTADGGPLEVGATVEVTHNKQTVKAVVQSVRDHSSYTVVFDDGDERNLRRTQICLKGARHFDADVSLDTMPLTSPEQFGAPVCPPGKSNDQRPKKRKNGAGDWDNSESEASDSDSEPGDPVAQLDYGRIVGYPEEGKGEQWAMVVCPKAHPQAQLRPEQVLIKLLIDSRFLSVDGLMLRNVGIREIREAEESEVRVRVLDYVERHQFPSGWDRKLLLNRRSEDAESAAESEAIESEPDEEHDIFVAQLYKYQDERGTPINKAPVLGGQDVTLYRFYKHVQKLGGFNRICNNGWWKLVLKRLKLEGCPGATSVTVKNCYARYLLGFDAFYRQLRCALDVSQKRSAARPSRSARMAEKQFKEKAKSLERPQRPASINGIPGPSPKQKAHERKTRHISLCSTGTETQRRSATPAERKSSRPKKKRKNPETTQPSDDSDDEKQPHTKDVNYTVGQKVRARYGLGHNKRCYEARVLQADGDGRFFLHYLGWKRRYDEWVTGDKIRALEEDSPKTKKTQGPAKGAKRQTATVSPPEGLAVPEPKGDSVVKKLDLARKKQEEEKERDSDSRSSSDPTDKTQGPMTRAAMRRNADRESAPPMPPVLGRVMEEERAHSAPAPSIPDLPQPVLEAWAVGASRCRSPEVEELRSWSSDGSTPEKPPEQEEEAAEEEEKEEEVRPTPQKQKQRRKRKRNYSEMVTGQRKVARTPRRDPDSDEEDSNSTPSKKDSGAGGSPKDSLAALKARLQHEMDQNPEEYKSSKFKFTSIDPSWDSDKKISVMTEQMQDIRDLYQKLKTELTDLDRNWRKSSDKKRQGDEEKNNSPMVPSASSSS